MQGLELICLSGLLGLTLCCALARGADGDIGPKRPGKVRVPYADEDQPGQEKLIRAIRARRSGGKLLNLDRMLLNSPAFAEGWNTMIGAVRNRLEVSPKLRELAIMAIAVLNAADYEYEQHKTEFFAAGGTSQQLSALADLRAAAENTGLFDDVERATLRLTYEMTRDVAVAESTVERLRALMPDREVVELVGIIAAYNMVSRFLVALGIESE
jgi:alkylhydroperoxidase family enzyme